MTEPEKPKPCPFCGSDRIRFCVDAYTSIRYGLCVECKARGPEFDTYWGADVAWNRRKVER